MNDVSLHDALSPLAGLLGRWVGTGRGAYPSVDDFTYLEEVTFWHNGRPFLGYSQRTRHPDKGFPMHGEDGYWRVVDGGIEIVLAHTFGLVEVSEGTISEGVVETRTKSLQRTSTAKKVEGLTRRYAFDSDRLEYEVQMAYGANPMQFHLGGTLRRVGA